MAENTTAAELTSAHAALLNRLSEMQAAPYYATARGTLAEAEQTIVQLEADVRNANEARAFMLAACHEAQDIAAKTQEQAARAFEIADEAMFELIESEGVPGDEYRTVFGLIDEYSLEVDELAKASPALREAFEWLQPRGYVELGQDKDGEFINVIRRPGED